MEVLDSTASLLTDAFDLVVYILPAILTFSLSMYGWYFLGCIHETMQPLRRLASLTSRPWSDKSQVDEMLGVFVAFTGAIAQTFWVLFTAAEPGLTFGGSDAREMGALVKLVTTWLVVAVTVEIVAMTIGVVDFVAENVLGSARGIEGGGSAPEDKSD